MHMLLGQMQCGGLEPRFQSFLGGTHAARILCIGDVMLDRFVYGRVDRVSAEAPVQILHVSSKQAMLGGVGNVGRNVVALGAQAVLVAVTGDDQAAREITDLAECEERLTPRLIVEAGRPSTVKTRYIAEGQQLLRADDEVTAPISDETARRLIAAIRLELDEADVMVLSDYMKGVLTDDVLAIAIADARVAGVPVIADPKRDNFGSYSGVAILKPNEAELAAASRLPCGNDGEVEDSARKVMSDCEIDAMIVSRSQQGMSLIQRDAKALHFSAKAQEVLDVSGAGDTVVATTAVALAAGAELAFAAELANVAGGIVVGKVGTAVVSRDEFDSVLTGAGASPSEAKVTSADGALAAVDRWRERGQKIGFTNGCFDLLHPGHVSLLTEAKAACDRLVVAMNSDESVKRLKGEGRPVQPETARAIVLASLSMVDVVVVFSEDTPIDLIQLLKPDVLIKGSNYTIDQVVGADWVRSYGGEVKLAALVPGHSSTEVIAKMSSGSAPRARGVAITPST
jgi:D-beta-D-heptose 7-phosphate kinase/D-beta-D-heptose 1-phosphate adenosyltransferase